MALRIAINGFGRIGRAITRIALQRSDIEIVAINDLMDISHMAYLLENDSVHGRLGIDVSYSENRLHVGSSVISVFNEANPQTLNFATVDAEVVLECSGRFLTTEMVKHHIEKGIKRVIISAPANDEVTPTFVLGVNEKEYKGEAIISNGSCTTNCLAPIALLLDNAYGIDKALMTTIHAYTNDQNLLDGTHRRDIRRMRAAGVNMIPTSTGAAKALHRVLPQLKGKLHGQSVRVPTPDVSMMDLNIHLKQSVSVEELVALFKEAANADMRGVLHVDSKQLVSQDFVGSSYSSIVAEDLIQVIGGDLVKVMAWYDNEWGYSNRLLDMANYILHKGA